MKPEYLEPTDIIDSGHKVIVAKADSLTAECKTNPIESAIRLYYFVRDEIRYDPYYPFYLAKRVYPKTKAYRFPQFPCLRITGRHYLWAIFSIKETTARIW